MTARPTGARAPAMRHAMRGHVGTVLAGAVCLLAVIGAAAHGQPPTSTPTPASTRDATPAPAAASAAFRRLARDLTGDWSVSTLTVPAHDGHHHHGAGHAVILPAGRDRLRIRLQAHTHDAPYRVDAEIVAEADGTYRLHWRDDATRPDWHARGRHDAASGTYVFAAEASPDTRLTLSAPAPGRVELTLPGDADAASPTPARLVLTRQD